MLKSAAATKGDCSRASDRGAVPNPAAAQLERPKSNSAPNLGGPSVSHRAMSGPVVDSRMTGRMGAGTNVGEEAGGVPSPGSQRARWMQKEHAGKGAVQASVQAPEMMQGDGTGQDAGQPMIATEDDISEWLPAADLWGPSVCVLPAQHEPDPVSQISGAGSPAEASIVPPQFQNSASSERSHGPTYSRIAQRGPGPVAESVEEGEDQGMGSQDPHAASASADAPSETSDEHTAPSDGQLKEEALTLDQQLSGGRPRTPLRPRSSSGLPRQVLQVRRPFLYNRQIHCLSHLRAVRPHITC